MGGPARPHRGDSRHRVAGSREGALAVRDEAVHAVMVPSVVARVQPTNARSIAVAKAVGLTRDFSTTGTFGEPVLVYRLWPSTGPRLNA